MWGQLPINMGNGFGGFPTGGKTSPPPSPLVKMEAKALDLLAPLLYFSVSPLVTSSDSKKSPKHLGLSQGVKKQKTEHSMFRRSLPQ